MAKELQAVTTSGLTLYAVLINSVGQFWNTSGTPAFETYNVANWTDYDIILTETGAGIYFGDMPAVASGNYSYVVYEQAGVIPATTDTLKGTGSISWDGTSEGIVLNNLSIDRIWDEPLSNHLIVGTMGKKLNDLSSSFGNGSIVYPYSVTDASLIPIADALIEVSTTIDKTNVVASGYTDFLGNITFYLDPGTYYFFTTKAGWTFVNPDQEIVA